MKSIVVAPVSEKMDDLFVGIREFPTEKVILIASEKYLDEAHNMKKNLGKFKIPASIIEIKGDIWEETFRTIAEIKASSNKKVLINVATGDSVTKCAATSAAFVNGLNAFDVMRNKVMHLPVLKFSYYKLIPEKKMKILNLLNEDEECCASFEELSKKLKMSLPLISYHINGNLKSEGLKQMNLVEVTEKKGRMQIKLSTMGRLIIKGYVT